jgi:hypothetical protein
MGDHEAAAHVAGFDLIPKRLCRFGVARGLRGFTGLGFADLPEILTDFRAVNLRGRKSLRDFRENAA